VVPEGLDRVKRFKSLFCLTTPFSATEMRGVPSQVSNLARAEMKTFAETYTMRSRFYQGLGEAAKALADTYTYDTDADNRAAFKELIWDAVCHSLVEHHGFKAEEL